MNFYKDGGAILALLGGNTENLTEITANTVDASREKHIPVCEAKDGKIFIKVGEAEHPMAESHYIEWIAVQTNKGFYAKTLEPNQKPEACFTVDGETVKAVFAYCNLHGLWKS